MNVLDFVVIGAQKCATTTLFELLRQHPEIALPLEKEVPLFTDPEVDGEALDRFAEQYFGPRDGRLRGKVTPQYMGDAAVPARIAEHLPDCKLIAVLRDPIERSRSHHLMGRRRGVETRDFPTAIAELLEPARLSAARAGSPPSHATGYESESDYYLAWSEYGRVLAGYSRHFPAGQLLVIYSEDLKARPREVLDEILAFLEVDRNFAPTGLGEVMHAGGGSNKIPHGLRVWLRDLPPVAALWSLVPPQQQGRLRFLYERWNARKRATEEPLAPALEARLRQHFAADLALLGQVTASRPPWLAAYEARNAMPPVATEALPGI